MEPYLRHYDRGNGRTLCHNTLRKLLTTNVDYVNCPKCKSRATMIHYDNNGRVLCSGGRSANRPLLMTRNMEEVRCKSCRNWLEDHGYVERTDRADIAGDD